MTGNTRLSCSHVSAMDASGIHAVTRAAGHHLVLLLLLWSRKRTRYRKKWQYKTIIIMTKLNNKQDKLQEKREENKTMQKRRVTTRTKEKWKENYSQQSSLKSKNPNVPSTEMEFPVWTATESLCIKNTKERASLWPSWFKSQAPSKRTWNPNQLRQWFPRQQAGTSTPDQGVSTSFHGIISSKTRNSKETTKTNFLYRLKITRQRNAITTRSSSSCKRYCSHSRQLSYVLLIDVRRYENV